MNVLLLIIKLKQLGLEDLKLKYFRFTSLLPSEGKLIKTKRFMTES